MPVTVSIPGWDTLSLANVLFDLNGTLAQDGMIAESTRERLTALGDVLTLYVMSADTHGTLEQVCADLPLIIHRVETPLGAPAKRQWLESLGRGKRLRSAMAGTTSLCSKPPPWGSPLSDQRGRQKRRSWLPIWCFVQSTKRLTAS